MTDQKIRTTASAHWYTQQGKPCHQVPYADKKRAAAGEMRDTTLSDARKLGLLPSVTTILKIMAKPQISDWVSTHYLNAGLQCAWDFLKERLKKWKVWTGKRYKVYKEVVFKEAMELADKEMSRPADLGTAIHHDIEAWLMGVPTVILPKKTLNALDRTLVQIFKEFELPPIDQCIYETERVVVGDGYAGCIDLLIHTSESHRLVIDWKSQETAKYGGKGKFWPEQAYQGSAYGLAACKEDNASTFDFVTVVVSRDEPGGVYWKRWTETETREALDIFTAAKKLWYLIKKL